MLEPLRLRPEVERLLLDIGMPPDNSPIYDGKRRAADKPEEAARKFVIWARAIGAVGSYPAGIICALYGECAAADHRVAVSDNRFLFALKHTPGIRRDLADADRRRRLWTIEPAEVIKPEPAPTPPKAIAKPPLNKPRLFHRYVPEQQENSLTRHDPGQSARGSPTRQGAQAARLALAQRGVISRARSAHHSAGSQRPIGRPMRSAIGSNAMHTL